MIPVALREYKGHKVDHDELIKDLCFICFINYDQAYEIMICLVEDGYMIQDLGYIDDKNCYVLWFNEQ